MSKPTCAHCTQPATHRVVGHNYRGPVDTCESHLGQTQRAAGVPRGTEAITDDAQEALFDMPPVVKRMGLR